MSDDLSCSPLKSFSAFLLLQCFPWAAKSEWLSVTGKLRQPYSWERQECSDGQFWFDNFWSVLSDFVRLQCDLRFFHLIFLLSLFFTIVKTTLWCDVLTNFWWLLSHYSPKHFPLTKCLYNRSHPGIIRMWNRNQWNCRRLFCDLISFSNSLSP